MEQEREQELPSESTWELGEDIRNDSRLLQDEKWANAVKDGRVHISHREASTHYGNQLKSSIQAYEIVEKLVESIGDPTSLLSRLNYECLRVIVEYAFDGHGPLVTANVAKMNINYKKMKLLYENPLYSFRVFVRKRPMLSFEVETDAYDVLSVNRSTPFSIVLHDGRLARNGRQLTMAHRHYGLSKCFDEFSNNDDVCSEVLQPLLQNVFQGFDSTLLCYGQTGTGKTYTLIGALQFVAEKLCGKEIELICYEIYGKKCFDLLNNRNSVRLRADENEIVHPRGVKVVHFPTVERDDLVRVMMDAIYLRSSKVTERNPLSSRSHAILSIRIARHTSNGKQFSKLNLVDLAGSERNYETSSMTAAEHRESADINMSLLALKDCFRAYNYEIHRKSNDGPVFSEYDPEFHHYKGEDHVLSSSLKRDFDSGVKVIRATGTAMRAPYRASLLTRVLRECFVNGTNHKTFIIATVSPTPVDMEHTLNSLEHMIMMDRALQEVSWVNTVDVPIDGAAISNKPIEEWSCNEVGAWLATVDGGRFSQLVLPPGMNGEALLQLSENSLSALSAGELRKARQDEEGSAWVEEGTGSTRMNAIGKALWRTIRREQYASYRRSNRRDLESV